MGSKFTAMREGIQNGESKWLDTEDHRSQKGAATPEGQPRMALLSWVEPEPSVVLHTVIPAQRS